MIVLRRGGAAAARVAWRERRLRLDPERPVFDNG